LGRRVGLTGDIEDLYRVLLEFVARDGDLSRGTGLFQNLFHVIGECSARLRADEELAERRELANAVECIGEMICISDRDSEYLRPSDECSRPVPDGNACLELGGLSYISAIEARSCPLAL
jgi:hypothetical protein